MGKYKSLKIVIFLLVIALILLNLFHIISRKILTPILIVILVIINVININDPCNNNESPKTKKEIILSIWSIITIILICFYAVILFLSFLNT
ncbi:hypothetical protein [Clostridium ihumii]|uniref:hypothetical protein n=1 Tax=Clostridium ihumii TaxID=1470356 RepID=UPI000553F66B|nr:hypothetical protein [Clostridium ihumii]